MCRGYWRNTWRMYSVSSFDFLSFFVSLLLDGTQSNDTFYDICDKLVSTGIHTGRNCDGKIIYRWTSGWFKLPLKWKNSLSPNSKLYSRGPNSDNPVPSHQWNYTETLDITEHLDRSRDSRHYTVPSKLRDILESRRERPVHLTY